MRVNGNLQLILRYRYKTNDKLVTILSTEVSNSSTPRNQYPIPQNVVE